MINNKQTIYRKELPKFQSAAIRPEYHQPQPPHRISGGNEQLQKLIQIQNDIDRKNAEDKFETERLMGEIVFQQQNFGKHFP